MLTVNCVIILVLLYVTAVHAFRIFPHSVLLKHQQKHIIHKSLRTLASTDDSTLSEGFTEVKRPNGDLSTIVGKEEVFRKYQFAHKGLPTLDDANNFYSGKFDDFFWHQNADQVYVYYPLPEDVRKGEIKVDFDVGKVVVKIRGQEITSFKTFDRIIPDGSFWTIEEDKEHQRYMLLDMEKRYRMINWNALFADYRRELLNRPSSIVNSSQRSEMLEKLFAANKGLSKITGVPEETLMDMMQDESLMDAIDTPVQTSPKMTGTLELEDGSEVEFDEEVPDEIGMEMENVFQETLKEVREKQEKEQSELKSASNGNLDAIQDNK